MCIYMYVYGLALVYKQGARVRKLYASDWWEMGAVVDHM